MRGAGYFVIFTIRSEKSVDTSAFDVAINGQSVMLGNALYDLVGRTADSPVGGEYGTTG